MHYWACRGTVLVPPGKEIASFIPEFWFGIGYLVYTASTMYVLCTRTVQYSYEFSYLPSHLFLNYLFLMEREKGKRNIASLSEETPKMNSDLDAKEKAELGASPHWEQVTWQDLPPGSKFDNLGPCLALEAEMEGRGESPGAGKFALVPGCGRGYDCHLLASKGFQVVGLDLSPSATKAANDWKEKMDSPQARKDRVK